jgi:hypothetical protein
MKDSIQFPEAKKIDYTKFIEPKKQILVTKNGLTIAELTTDNETN